MNSLVNIGGGPIYSMGNNMRQGVTDNTGGLTYITPTLCTPGAAPPACGMI